jgi:hypothetical protein
LNSEKRREVIEIWKLEEIMALDEKTVRDESRSTLHTHMKIGLIIHGFKRFDILSIREHQCLAKLKTLLTAIHFGPADGCGVRIVTREAAINRRRKDSGLSHLSLRELREGVCGGCCCAV